MSQTLRAEAGRGERRCPALSGAEHSSIPPVEGGPGQARVAPLARRPHRAVSLPARHPELGVAAGGRAARGAAARAARLLARPRQTADGRPLGPLLPRHNGPGRSGAQWDRRGRTPAAWAEGRWPGCVPFRAACPWAAPGRPQPRGLRNSEAGPGVRPPIVRGRPQELGQACSTALGAASFPGPARRAVNTASPPGGPVRP